MGYYVISKSIRDTDKVYYTIFDSNTAEIREISKQLITNNSNIMESVVNVRYKEVHRKLEDCFCKRYMGLYNQTLELDKKTLVYIDFQSRQCGLVDSTGTVEWVPIRVIMELNEETCNQYNNIVFKRATLELNIRAYHIIGQEHEIKISQSIKQGVPIEKKEYTVDLREELNKKIIALEQENKALKGKISLIDKERQELRYEIIGQSKTIGKLENTIKRKETEISELTNKIETKEKEMASSNKVYLGTVEYYISKIKDMGLYDKMHIPVSIYRKLKARELETLENGLHGGECTLLESIKIGEEHFVVLVNHDWSKDYVIIQMITDPKNRKPIDTTMYNFIKIFKDWTNNVRFLHTY